MSGANVSPIGRNKEEWLVQATDYRKLNEPPRPRLQRNGTIYLMARPPLLCQGGDFAFSTPCARRLRRRRWLRSFFFVAQPPLLSQVSQEGITCSALCSA